MQVVLSYPFAGAVYWWFARQNPDRLNVDMRSVRPRHGYYSALYENPARNVDVALSCLVIFDQVILPSADAWLPSVQNASGEREVPELDIVSDWRPLERTREILDHRVDDVLADPAIAASVTGSDWTKRLQLEYAVMDCLLSSRYMAPVICSDRRRRVVRRVLELGLLDQDLDPSTSARMSQLSGDGAELKLASYTEVVGLTFAADDIYTLAELKHHDKIRSHASDFATMLTTADSDDVDSDTVAQMYEHIADAWDSADLAARVSGTFTAASTMLDVAGLIPGVGAVADAVALGADAVAAHAERRGERLKWYELGPEIARQRSLQELDAELRRRNMR